MALAAATKRLMAAGVEAPAREARYLLGLILKEGDRTPGSQGLDSVQGRAFDAVVTRRAYHEPFAYIAGRKEFWSLDFEVSPAVLIPRPDSETLVELALSLFRGQSSARRILDLGTGSGCLLLSLLSEWPDAHGTGIDRSEDALAIAQANARRHGFAGRAVFRLGDWCRDLEGPFDLAISNPPYVKQAEWAQMAVESREFEPSLAFLGGEDGLACYVEIATQAARVLRPGGLLVIEAGAAQSQAIANIFKAQSWEVVLSRRDLAGHERALAFRVPSAPI